MRHKPYFGALLTLSALSCGPVPLPAPPKPPLALPKAMHVVVRDSSGHIPEHLRGSIGTTEWSSTCVPLSFAMLSCDLPAGVNFGGTVSVRFEGDGCDPLLAEVQTAPDLNVALPRHVPPIERLHVNGRVGLLTGTGAAFGWKGATEFQLVEFVAHGREGEAARLLDDLKPATIFRVLVMAANLFQLTPTEGVAALPAALDLAAMHGMYLEVTIFADTASYPGIDYRSIAQHVGDICASHPAFAAAEIGNELSPLHETQADALGDLNFLKELRGIIRSRCDVPVSLGSTHADQDESDIFKDGDYLTVHGARGDGDWGNWRWVRHTNEQRALSEQVGRYVVNDEPRRDDLACDKQFGIALLTRIFHLGDTFHYGGGRFAIPPAGPERIAFECRVRGWTLIPDDWMGSYRNAGSVDSPIKGIDDSMTVRAYGSVNGSVGYELLLGHQPGGRIDWDTDRWPHRELLATEGTVELWKVSR